jgi:hypothetical protein
MANRIRELHLQDRLDDPAEAEVWVGAVPEAVAPTTEVRGRLMGPQCHYATTVEVAYPLRPFSGPRHPQPVSPRGRGVVGEGVPRLGMRVIIPEASLWDPESPFLYHGPVELWEDGCRCDQREVRHGLRRLSLGPRGLRCNGRPLAVHGVAREALSEDEGRDLRARGCNTLVAPVTAAAAGLWEAADRLGFLVIGRVGDAGAWALADDLRGHCCCLGWLLAPAAGGEDEITHAIAAWRQRRQPGWLGLALAPGSGGALPEGIDFVVCPEAALAELRGARLPKIVLVERGVNGQASSVPPTTPDVLGWVEGARS